METNVKMMRVVLIGTLALSALSSAWAEDYAEASSAAVPADTTFVDGSDVDSTLDITYGPFSWDGSCMVTLNGQELLSSTNSRSCFTWQPRKLGVNTLVWSSAGVAMTSTVNVVSLSFAVSPEPNPPMEVDPSISITPTTRTFAVGGGGNAILTSGSGTWKAAVSEPWITLSAASGTVGTPVAYTVSASTNIGPRVGYVYVSGRVHTVTQNGYEAEVSPMEITAECDGRTGTITLDSPGRYAWDARSNDDWLTITPTHGVASGVLSYQVAPYDEVSTRTGSFTVGDKTVTVFQYGRRMKLATVRETCDYLTHVIPITVNALAVTAWNVTPNASWISIVDGGNGQGGDTVSIAVAENPSYLARTGTVTIGTETFTVTQEGRTALSFNINPLTATAAVSGGNGLLAVTATPDLPWTATSDANWLTIVAGFASGAGNGNVVYNASPNSTLNDRVGTITVTPVEGAGLNAKTLTVTQPAATASISMTGYEFEASGETIGIDVTVNGIVEWSVDESLDWISVAGSTSRVGPGTVTISASANDTVYPRSGTIVIAGKEVAVSQKARGVQIEYESIVFGIDGGMSSVSIHPDGNVAWTAVASDPWIIVFMNPSGTGDAEVEYILAPYEGDGSPRTGWIEIGDKKVYITQRAYDLDISPRSDWVTGNSGAGEIGVAAGLGDIWGAIVTEPWITIVTGYDAGTGSGTVRFTYTENNTGKTRTGKILVAGEEYTLTQAARVVVNVAAEAVGGGTVSGAGAYTLGETATLEALPGDGYEFLYWTGDAGETMQNPIRVTADVAKSVTAHFGPLTPEFTDVECSTEGVKLTWRNLAWATQYKIYRAPTNEFPTQEIVTLPANGSSVYLDTTGEAGKTYFYWVEAIGATDTTESADAASGAKQKPIVISGITYTNLRGTTHTNPATYQEGHVVAFTPPSALTGYTFAGWTPSGIAAETTGNVTARANWTANSYSIAYHANGGSGTLAATMGTYDAEAAVASNAFTRAGYVFLGWATAADGPVVYAEGQIVSNLTAVASGVVELFAVWEADRVADPVVTPADGSVFKTDSCEVTLSCATPDAVIYYSTNGRTPSERESFRYKGTFTISETTTVIAFAVKNGKASEYVEATITKVIPTPLTLKGVLDEEKLGEIATDGEADWQPVEDETAKVGMSCAVSGALVDDDEAYHESVMQTTVSGKGTLTFWWRVSCEPDPRGRFTYDYAAFEADDVVVARKDGITDWVQVTKTFDTDGAHVIRWIYSSDGYLPLDDGYESCVWVDGVVWTGAGGPVVLKPYLVNDANATVTGDASTGFVLTPSTGMTDVEVGIPQGVDAAKVTLAVPVEVRTVTPNGAKVVIMKGGYDVTAFLDVPMVNGNGVIDMTQAKVKAAIVKDVLDPAKGAVIDLAPANPVLITSPTKPGLTYILREGAQLNAMGDGDQTIGNGQPWTPRLDVKGGKSGFYSIKVTK